MIVILSSSTLVGIPTCILYEISNLDTPLTPTSLPQPPHIKNSAAILRPKDFQGFENRPESDGTFVCLYILYYNAPRRFPPVIRR